MRRGLTENRGVWWLTSAILLGCGPTTPRAEEPEAIVMFQDEEEANSAPTANDVVERAESLLARGEAAEAEALLREGFANDSIDADDARAFLDLGLALELQERFTEAADAYRSAIDVRSDFPEPHNNLGVLLRESGALAEAIASFERALELRPSFASAHLNLAMAREDAGDLPGAIRSYESVIELAPREPSARVHLGLLQIATGDSEMALVTLRGAVRLAQGNRALLTALGNGLRRAGDPQLAVRVLDNAVGTGDESPQSALLAELALARYATGDREQAEIGLERLLAERSDYAIAHYLLANMLAARQEFAEAAEHYRGYLRLAPDGAQADMARARLAAVEGR